MFCPTLPGTGRGVSPVGLPALPDMSWLTDVLGSRMNLRMMRSYLRKWPGPQNMLLQLPMQLAFTGDATVLNLDVRDR